MKVVTDGTVRFNGHLGYISSKVNLSHRFGAVLTVLTYLKFLCTLQQIQNIFLAQLGHFDRNFFDLV